MFRRRAMLRGCVVAAAVVVDQARAVAFPGTVCRRSALAGAVSSGLATVAGAVPSPLAECRTSTNALFSRRVCARSGLDAESRLVGCLPSENCVSTSAIASPSQFGAPWSYAPTTSDPATALAALVEALKESGATVDLVNETALYVHATAPSTITGYVASDVDDLEFLLAPRDDLVLYRSASREAVFFFPPQNLYSVPLSDGDSNRLRLDAIRKRLGWQSLGPLYAAEDEEDDPSNYLPLQDPDDAFDTR